MVNPTMRQIQGDSTVMQEILQVILVQIPGAGRGFFTLPFRLQRLPKPYLSGTRTVALAQTPGGGAQSLLNPPRRRPPPELGAFRARRRPRSVLQAGERSQKRQVRCERAFVLCSGLGAGSRSPASLPRGAADIPAALWGRGAGVLSAVVGLT
ncbi:hypothetical protein LEMLEM_LOCUS13260 [Lemmus lemmus]